MEFLLAYIVSIPASFWLYQDSWRRAHDFTRSDMVFFSVYSLIPVMNIVLSVPIWLFFGRGLSEKTVWRRK